MRHLAERGRSARQIGGWFIEKQGSKEANSRVKKRKDIGPSNVNRRVRNGDRVEKSSGATVNSVVCRTGAAMPKEPPSSSGVWQRNVVWVATKKVAVVLAISVAIWRSFERLR